MKPTYVVHHLGLGDHIICAAIFRSFHATGNRYVLPVKRRNARSLAALLSDLDSFRLQVLPDRLADGLMQIQAGLHLARGLPVLRLGWTGADFLSPLSSRSFDEEFYRQAGLSFDLRWVRALPESTQRNKKGLLERFGLTARQYAFVHDDPTRSFGIRPESLPRELQIFRPRKEFGLSILDYAEIIDSAGEIHCIDSSFLSLVESLQPTAEKYLHVYARSHSAENPRFLPTLRLPWIHIK